MHVGTRYADTTRQASTYRRGRVLLCGDSAHVHSPAGGQGMNLGLGNAMNLGWKLALVARGEAPESLLDTYTAERHPIGDRVLRWSMAQTALSTPAGPRADALREVMADLLDTVDGATYVISTIGGDWQRYGAAGGHPLLGTRIPDVALRDGTTLAAAFEPGRAVLVDPAGAFDAVAAPWAHRLTIVPPAGARTIDSDSPLPDPAAVLVRPDGYVAWVATAPGDATGLRDVLTCWLGPPLP